MKPLENARMFIWLVQLTIMYTIFMDQAIICITGPQAVHTSLMAPYRANWAPAEELGWAYEFGKEFARQVE